MASAERVPSLSVLLCLALSLGATWGKRLEEGEIAYKAVILPSGVEEVAATDGLSALKGTVSSTEGFQTCHVDTSPEAVDSILNDPAASVRNIGVEEIEGMWKRCQQAEMAGREREGRALSLQSRAFGIMPGTKWCGMGNSADNYDDLGESAETDKCCRTHDHCADFIPAWGTKYHTSNTMPWTCSHCDCDTQFYHCLKDANTSTANKVGGTFFGTLKMSCFVLTEKETCIEYHYTYLWCNEYGIDTVAEIQDPSLRW